MMFDPRKLMDMMKNGALNEQGIMQELKVKTVEGSAGGGMVKVLMNGQFEIQSVTIEPSVLQLNDHTLLQDLIKGAVNDAVRGARDLWMQEVRTLTTKLGLPMGFGA